jgi:ADP-heptose:LPS heptosyltransferase
VKVLLVRADGIGDALACAPLVAALRDGGHTVSAVMGTGNRDIFAPRTFEAVHVLERIPWPRHGSTPDSIRRALAEVRAARYDVALIASEEIEAFAFARDARIPERAGFVNGFEKPLKTLQVRSLLTRAIVRPASATRVREHEVQTLFRLGTGLTNESAATTDPQRLRSLILEEPVAPSGSIVLQVSRKLAKDGLDIATYVALARELAERGERVVALGDDGDAVAEVARGGGAEARSDLLAAQWRAAIAGARAIVTPDSGAAHVAGMLGVPCVDCFPSRAATPHDIVRWRPWLPPYRTVVLALPHDPAKTAATLSAATADLLR